jgi:DNA-binding transcriptional regulator YdaS (Cro superfamily)
MGKPKQPAAIVLAINCLGDNMAELARKVGVYRQTVERWKRTGKVSAQHVLAVEAATGGRITRYELRPDIYGAPPA